jgi:hypothetical protein
MNQSTLIAKINKAIPEALAVPASEFSGRESDSGIWFRGSEDCAADGNRIFDYYNMNNMFHPILNKIITDAGWFASPHDAGTLMAYK